VKRSSETNVHIRTTRIYIPEDGKISINKYIYAPHYLFIFPANCRVQQVFCSHTLITSRSGWSGTAVSSSVRFGTEFGPSRRVKRSNPWCEVYSVDRSWNLITK
jgi:hypothetical protein